MYGLAPPGSAGKAPGTKPPGLPPHGGKATSVKPPGGAGTGAPPGGMSALLGMFPSASLTSHDLNGVLSGARQQITRDYAAAPMPSLSSYLQPFADASARATANGTNYANYLSGATDYAGKLSSAFGATLASGIAQGQAAGVAQGGSGTGIPNATESSIPLSAVGSNFTNYLNALKPSVGASVQETQRMLNAEQSKAQGSYEQASATRNQDMQTAIEKLYGQNVGTLQTQRNNDLKNSLAEYALTGKTSYQDASLAARKAHNKATETTAGVSAQTAKDRLALEGRRLDAQITHWQTQASAGTKSGIKGLSQVMRALTGGTRFKTLSNDYQVQKILLADDAHGNKKGQPYGSKTYVSRGPRQGPPRTNAQGWLLGPDGKPTGERLVSTTPRVKESKDKVSVPLTGAQWDQAARLAATANNWTPEQAAKYLTQHFSPRPAGP